LLLRSLKYAANATLQDKQKWNEVRPVAPWIVEHGFGGMFGTSNKHIKAYGGYIQISVDGYGPMNVDGYRPMNVDGYRQISLDGCRQMCVGR
jgi:hypothetical protein